MARQTVYLAVDFTINEGKRDAFEAIAQEMVAGSQKLVSDGGAVLVGRMQVK